MKELFFLARVSLINVVFATQIAPFGSDCNCASRFGVLLPFSRATLIRIACTVNTKYNSYDVSYRILTATLLIFAGADCNHVYRFVKTWYNYRSLNPLVNNLPSLLSYCKFLLVALLQLRACLTFSLISIIITRPIMAC